jgi:nitroreductase
MEFAEVLRRRKMVRRYTDEPVGREAVERIVARGRKAPRKPPSLPPEEVVRWEHW